MGPSGSGKTTMLDLLSGRKTTGKVTGSVLFGGQQPSTAMLRRFCGYCEQTGKEGGGGEVQGEGVKGPSQRIWQCKRRICAC